MAQHQGIPQPFAQQNKGTLMPGQTISVNKYTVQVERYLSQGTSIVAQGSGFAHVYLVRTATPVYNTTHHVLKRIAVPNEAMLTEVKKEVDIMRILKGHPNIVYLIDAAWHRSSDGVYEVFILMEFCPGGGIIDMMNRRLRERLTEPEILTIFVDVCEGLAAMHALKPPLLHRDLKVENILQSTPTSYKLCDFGSATPVQKVPSNMQELRALEHDLNKHTTLQYRAPEMVDVYQRRPIDEKSDVWALGVLLYKLCYYTTPFEEHGPLAILNVQYKIPPYPVYSPQMNALIASMLREHGAQRPTVFELLNHIHALRGSQSRFAYNIPPKQPLVSPRASQDPLRMLSPNITSPPTNPLDDLVMFRSRNQSSMSPARNTGIEARDKVLEAIAPMRRGRPAFAAPSPPSSPKKERDRSGGARFNFDMKFGAEEDRAWRGVRGHKSGMASIGGGATVNLNEDAWGLDSTAKEKMGKDRPEIPGFDSDFSSSFSKGFGDTFEPSKFPPLSPSPSKPISQALPIPSRPTPSPGISGSPSKRKDAFDGLGFPSQPPVQTLGDVHRARTGLAGMSAAASPPTGQYLNAPRIGVGSSFTTYRPPSQSPAPSPNPRPSSRPQSPAITSRPLPKPTRSVELSAEERFPSLEDLDRTFTSPHLANVAPPAALHSTSQLSFTDRLRERSPERPSSSIARPPSRTTTNATGGGRTSNLLDIPSTGTGNAFDRGGRHDGVRSQHVTGSAMRESKLGHSRTSTVTDASTQDSVKYQVRRAGTLSHHPRPVQPRRHRSSISMKQNPPSDGPSTLVSNASSSGDTRSPPPPALPPRPSPQPAEQRDWLTGLSDDEAQAAPAPQPVLRDSPSKRASFIERSPLLLEKPLEAENVIPAMSDLDPQREPSRSLEREKGPEKPKAEQRPWERGRLIDVAKLPTGDRSHRHDTGRQSPTKNTRVFMHKAATGSGLTGGLQLPGMGKRAPPPLSSSPSGLTDNWSPMASPTRTTARKGSLSSEDEGPEDINGYVPKGLGERMKALDVSNEKPSREPEPRDQHRRRQASKGRQNSVHNLVDLWGSTQDKAASPTKLADKRRSAIVTSSSMMKPSLAYDPGLPAMSPPIVSPTPSAPPAVPSSNRALPRPPSVQQVRKQTSIPTGTNTRTAPSASPASPPAVSSTSTGRSRPQSMFINPVSKTAPLESPALSSPTPKDREQADSSAIGSKQRRTTRRTSISDMVQRYEAISDITKQGPTPPTVATKPTPLSVKAVASESSTTGVPSPSAVVARFPQLSPPSSPKATKTSLAVPDDSDPVRRGLLQGRRSPSPATRTASPHPLPGLTNPALHRPNGGPAASRTPAVSLPGPTTDEEQGRPGEDAPPERPYQGVSKLIDRWQRVVNDAEGGPGRPVRKPTGSLSGR
ncbi:hypothetical protein PHLGIDRAFT_115784 [Phlebiopsis gigantea 11061_1 CR5-6]|uniref:non-specific serine/threonine protein kinase n=1 Tax=Phlebiopsis gigantea (strain 11061_1 CR5-6) TaxID=745531 RepID=A0A0C3PS48_PHLG1|nr:hypothetical protein PHLGIDRAFT_115784 [Phlebiopsis gigantea 11061_1 CR5-6]